jgi:hypothetical protein
MRRLFVHLKDKAKREKDYSRAETKCYLEEKLQAPTIIA